MFLKPKSFEQSLRGGIVPAVPAAPGSGLNPNFHKGCTGKAHACGTNKSHRAGGSATSASGGSRAGRQTPKAQRKNSISSETISESGSENSNSWPSSSSAAVPATVPPPKPPRLAATKAKEAAAIDCSPVQPPFTPTFERSTKRSLSFRSNNSKTTEVKLTPGASSSIRPPWNISAAAASKYAAAAASAPQSPNPSTRSSFRRRRDAQNAGLHWPAILASSLAASHKNYDAILKQKVRIITLLVCQSSF